MNNPRYVGLELRSLGNLIRRKSLENNDVRLENITPLHGWIITYLMEHEGSEIFQRDLEQEFSMRRSTVSRALQLMEKNGLIERREVNHDARLKRIHLKKAAYEAHEARMKDIEIIEEDMLIGVTEDEQDVFYNILSKMKKNLE